MRSKSFSTEKRLFDPYLRYGSVSHKWEITPSKKKSLFVKKISAKRVLQIICVTICLICFSLQISQLVEIYLSGKTIVENRVERLKYSQLPAMTICLPTFIDMNRFADYWLKNSNNEKGKEEYEKFTRYKDDILANRWDDGIASQSIELSGYFLSEAFGKNIEKFNLGRYI